MKLPGTPDRPSPDHDTSSSNAAERELSLEEFVRIVAHDLKSPLISVAGYLSKALETDEDALSSESREGLERALEIVKRMDGMAQSLLDYSRARGRRPEVREVEMENVMRAAVENLRHEVESAEAEIDWPPLPVVCADEAMLVQLFQNLIGNAVKFSFDQTPRVRIDAEHVASGWTFSVSDNGVGIDAKYASRIFKAFERLHSVDEAPGSGLGLASCLSIVNRHGGRIWFESSPGRGSTFYVFLPDHSPHS